MSDGNPGLSTKRFVPSGVDAQSWIGFEHRIQERRFKALLETISGALARHDGVAARIALEEARELRPNAPELDVLSLQITLLPSAQPAAASTTYSWYRGLGAVGMLAAGVGLMVVIDSIRSEPPTQTPVDIVATAATADTATATATPQTVAAPLPADVDASTEIVSDTPVRPGASESSADLTTSALTPQTQSPAAPQATAPAVTTSAARTQARPAPAEPTRSARQTSPGQEAVGTAGGSRTTNVEARRTDVPNRATFRAPLDAAGDRRGAAPGPIVQASREVPDDDVATSPRSESRPAFVELPPPSPPIAASVAPQPVSITAPPPVLPTASATVGTATVTTPRSDSTRVAQVLNQYARAYGQLDPTAARAVWPTVDERALSRAFSSLESQDVSFDKCDIDVKGNVASASCRGTTSYVGKVGSRQARTEPRQWNFELKLHGDDWKIEKAQAFAR